MITDECHRAVYCTSSQRQTRATAFAQRLCISWVGHRVAQLRPFVKRPDDGPAGLRKSCTATLCDMNSNFYLRLYCCGLKMLTCKDIPIALIKKNGARLRLSIPPNSIA